MTMRSLTGLLLAFILLTASAWAADALMPARGGQQTAIETFFKPTGKPEQLVLPLTLSGGKTTTQTYSGYVLVEASGEGYAGRDPVHADPIYGIHPNGQFGGGSGPFGLCMGFTGTCASDCGGEHIVRWIIFVPGEGWKIPTGDGENAPYPRSAPDHRYRFVIYLGQHSRRLTLDVGLRPQDGVEKGEGEFKVSLTPLALRPGATVPESSRWEPIAPNLLSLRGRRLLPVQTRSFSSTKSTRLPQASIAKDNYEVVFPGTDMLPVRLDSQASAAGLLSRDRLTLKPGVEVMLKMGNAGPYLIVKGRTERVTFGQFLTDPTLWTHKELNDTKYQLGRGYFRETAYEFFGLAKSHGQAYLGVCWYSPAASDHHHTIGFVFRLDWDGKQIKATPVRKLPNPGGHSYSPGPPMMDHLPNSDLILVEQTQMVRLTSRGNWQTIAKPLAQYVSFWLRGRWLLMAKDRRYVASVGYAQRIHRRDVIMTVLDVLTRRPVREFRWSELRKEGSIDS